MNVCFVGIVFQNDHVLAPVIEMVRPRGRVVFVEGPTAYYQKLGYTTSTDHTNEILHDLLGDGNVIHGQWAEKDEMTAATEALIPPDTDYVFWLDADESYTTAELDTIVGPFGLLESGAVDSMAFTADSFFGGFDHIVTGWERAFEVHRVQRWRDPHVPNHTPRWMTHRPPTVLAADGLPWRAHRHLSHLETLALGITLKHYSYVFPSQVQAKAGYYTDYDPTLCIPNYFDDVFMPWVLDRGWVRRREIEAQWNGVHNFLPARRGETFTAPFTGVHPEAIQAELPILRRRLADEQSSYLLGVMRKDGG